MTDRHIQMRALTHKQCEDAEIKDKPYKLSAGDGLYLYVTPKGGKYWRLKYYYLGKEKLMALGVFPTISLKNARMARDNHKRILAEGADPSAVKKAKIRETILKSKNTFELVAREWHEQQKGKWTPHHTLNVMRRLEMDVFPFIGKRPIDEINPPEVLEAVLRRIEKRGALDVVARVKQICGQIFRYGIYTGRCQRDQTQDLRGALKTRKTTHFGCIEIKEIPELLSALERNKPRLYERTMRATWLLMLCFTRTSELIKATWDEFDLDNAVWEIPAERMKMKKPHIVPLSSQAIQILREQYEETGHLNTPYVFPSQIRPANPMSNNTILFALGRLGYKGKMTGHGFRALAMSVIKEKLGYRHEVVDRQLAHDPQNKIDRAYDRAKFLDERKIMMQAYADFIDSQRATGQVIFKKFG